ncbi:MAG: hypothetical protein D6714_04385 [Bacteroidetes bacterium]|nr:MAG: hypothetical protein D6714_04385 [Bacteroidota bacterium]
MLSFFPKNQPDHVPGLYSAGRLNFEHQKTGFSAKRLSLARFFGRKVLFTGADTTLHRGVTRWLSIRLINFTLKKLKRHPKICFKTIFHVSGVAMWRSL